MNTGEREDLLYLLKALSDEHRLLMVAMMSEREYTVTEMAELLERTEPTVSHHVSKLHSVGLLRLRMAGNQRFYSINSERLAKFKAYAAEIDSLPTKPEVEVSDNAWIDALDWDTADKKLLRNYTFSGRLSKLPEKEKNWLVILRWLATKFQRDMRYSEKQVNAILTEVHKDYASLRRNLVEYGFMRRERGGGDYWLTPENETT